MDFVKYDDHRTKATGRSFLCIWIIDPEIRNMPIYRINLHGLYAFYTTDLKVIANVTTSLDDIVIEYLNLVYFLKLA
jgi:hypothetical protein